jgi:hypothetical protein
MNEPFLPPIKKPKGLIRDLVYAMSRRQFGKVLTPVKVYAARMPNAFGTFFGKVAGWCQQFLRRRVSGKCCGDVIEQYDSRRPGYQRPRLQRAS